jgi:hypothetical protein
MDSVCAKQTFMKIMEIVVSVPHHVTLALAINRIIVTIAFKIFSLWERGSAFHI